MMAASELDSKGNLWSRIAENRICYGRAWITVPESSYGIVIDLDKRSGRTIEHTEPFHDKVAFADVGRVFGWETKRIAWKSRTLGNLGCTYEQQNDCRLAGQLYEEALSLGSDENKHCNLSTCLLNRRQFMEAESRLLGVTSSFPFLKSFGHSNKVLSDVVSGSALNPHVHKWEPLILERPCNNSAMDWKTCLRKLLGRGTSFSVLTNVESSNKCRTEVCHASNAKSFRFKRDPIYDFQSLAKDRWKARSESLFILSFTPYNAALQFGRPLIFGNYLTVLWILAVRTNIGACLWSDFQFGRSLIFGNYLTVLWILAVRTSACRWSECFLHENAEFCDQLAKKGYLAASVKFGVVRMTRNCVASEEKIVCSWEL